MKISNAPVSYQTHVRPSQVRDMIWLCNDLQKAFNDLAYTPTPRHFLNPVIDPDWHSVASKWSSQPEVKAFREGALHNHFVCANWKTFEQLQGEAYRSRKALLQNRPLVPKDVDFLWLRRFIHSVAVWEVNTHMPPQPTLQVAAQSGWSLIASVLQQELEQTDSEDPWAVFRR